MNLSFAKRSTPWVIAFYTGAVLAISSLLFISCGRKTAPQKVAPVDFDPKHFWKEDRQQATSTYCRECHQDVFESWETSHHHFANQVASPERHGERFTGDPIPTSDGGSLTFIGKSGTLRLLKTDSAGEETVYPIDMVLAHTPLQQLVVPNAPGSWQVTQLAWDPREKEWFDVFPDDRVAGEWGHWTGRGMNWNSQCADCHMTDYDKNYQLATNTFESRWIEQGISCIQCHGRMEGHELPGADLEQWRLSSAQTMDSCFTCHSRREALTSDFQPGDAFFDHYRLELASDPQLYYPDGQIKEEVFVAGSFLQSKMHAAGVRCQDCHEPHSQELLYPVENNALCLSCHSPPGRLDAPSIQPLEHSNHAAGSAGNQCVSCHMPHTTYMQRDPRRDHGFHSPDPTLTLELGIPNACNSCHQDQSADWSRQKVEEWYPQTILERDRPRTRAIAAAREGNSGAAELLLHALERENRPFWRATLLDLLQNYPQAPELDTLTRQSLSSEHPLIRSSGVRLAEVLGWQSESLWQTLREDSSRLVRFEALAAQYRTEPTAPEPPADFKAYLELHADQPAGAARLSQFYFYRQAYGEAISWMQRALSNDPEQAGLYRDLARMEHAVQNIEEARDAFARAVQLAPDNGQYFFEQGLFLAEIEDMEAAIESLENAALLDPEQHRIHYNLGLAQAQQRRWLSAIRALNQAVALQPNNLDYQYSLAIIYRNAGDPEKAAELARDILQQNPAYQPARALLQPGP